MERSLTANTTIAKANGDVAGEAGAATISRHSEGEQLGGAGSAAAGWDERTEQRVGSQDCGRDEGNVEAAVWADCCAGHWLAVQL